MYLVWTYTYHIPTIYLPYTYHIPTINFTDVCHGTTLNSTQKQVIFITKSTRPQEPNSMDLLFCTHPGSDWTKKKCRFRETSRYLLFFFFFCFCFFSNKTTERRPYTEKGRWKQSIGSSMKQWQTVSSHTSVARIEDIPASLSKDICPFKVILAFVRTCKSWPYAKSNDSPENLCRWKPASQLKCYLRLSSSCLYFEKLTENDVECMSESELKTLVRSPQIELTVSEYCAFVLARASRLCCLPLGTACWGGQIGYTFIRRSQDQSSAQWLTVFVALLLTSKVPFGLLIKTSKAFSRSAISALLSPTVSKWKNRTCHSAK